MKGNTGGEIILSPSPQMRTQLKFCGDSRVQLVAAPTANHDDGAGAEIAEEDTDSIRWIGLCGSVLLDVGISYEQ